MTTTIPLAEVQAQLPQLIARLGLGDQILITADDKPIAEIRLPTAQPRHPQYGICEGMIGDYIEDDEHLKDFVEYMQ